MSIRQRVFAWLFYSFLSDRGQPDLNDSMTRDVRAPLLAQARGDVLEIGAGDGANLPLYPADVRLTLLDPNRYLLDYVPGVSLRSSGPPCQVVNGVAEALPFLSERFDTIVSAHVLCSVRDQPRALGEIRRVLRPGGQLLFLEHVTASPGSGVYQLQRLINPVWRLLGDGCHLTHDTETAIRQAGFQRVQLRSFKADYPSFVSPHIVGTAWR